MLMAIKQFFEQKLLIETQVDNEYRLKLATAALMIEMMRQDGKTRDEEVEVIKNTLQTRFELDKAETGKLFDLATEQAKQAVDLYQFTSLIHKHFSPEDKIRIVENLWTVAFADNELDPHEEHLIRRISDLLYVPHSDFIKTKHKVQKALGLD